jgi:hypothetical protein
MIPDIDQLDAHLANQQAGFISIGFRGVSQMFGNQTTSVPNSSGRWINLSPFESDEFGIPRAFVRLTSNSTEDAIANAMDSAIFGLANQLAGNNFSCTPGRGSQAPTFFITRQTLARGDSVLPRDLRHPEGKLKCLTFDVHWTGWRYRVLD